MADFSKLQNGSDIRGVAIAGVPGENVNLGADTASAIMTAYVDWLSEQRGRNAADLKVCIGTDSRLSGPELKEAALAAVSAKGAASYDAGTATTPAMFMSTVMPGFDMDGAVMITASHLPYNRNGFKFFTADGGLDKEDISAILKRAEIYFDSDAKSRTDGKGAQKIELMDGYAAYLRGLISSEFDDDGQCLEGMHIVVDAGNGAAGFFATDVLAPLGADISGSLYLDPDGSFPNHAPNPEDKAAIEEICAAVRDSSADLGIIFDTDGDRSAAVAPGGIPVIRNEIVAIAAALAAGEHPGGTVVTDSITSNELTGFLEDKLGLKHYRYRRGYRNVIRKAMELSESGDDAFLAIETSGHAAYSDNYFLDDGAYLAVRIVISAAKLKTRGRNIGYLIKDLESPAESAEIRYRINREDFAEYAQSILTDMEEWADRTEGLELVRPNYEGVRVNFRTAGKEGWFLLRRSLHDPVMPLNIESTDEGGVAAALDLISELMHNYEGIEMP